MPHSGNSFLVRLPDRVSTDVEGRIRVLCLPINEHSCLLRCDLSAQVDTDLHLGQVQRERKHSLTVKASQSAAHQFYDFLHGTDDCN